MIIYRQFSQKNMYIDTKAPGRNLSLILTGDFPVLSNKEFYFT